MSSITLCAIARNEAELLPRMLASVQEFVDEMVVVDTGSTDETVAIARSFGARVIEHAFQDDFSDARNVALNAAGSRWVLVLDADEYLAEGAGAVIRRAVKRRDRSGFYLHFINHLGRGRQHVCAMARLFRSDPAIRFRYVIHEQIVDDLLIYSRRHRLPLEVLDDAIVHHDGYLKERSEARGKDERNERLFRLQVERYPDHAYSWYKFGDFLRRFEGRSEESLRALRRSASLLRGMDRRTVLELSFPAEVFALLAVDTDKAGDPRTAYQIASEGRERYGETPNLLFVIGHLEAKFGRHRAAFLAYARLRTYDRRLLAVPPEPGVTGPIAMFGMGRALAALGHPRAAHRCLQKSLQQNPEATEPRLLLARLLLERGEVNEAISNYRKILAAEPDRSSVRLRLGMLLLHAERPAEAVEELRRAADEGVQGSVVWPKLGQALMAAGELEEAYRVFSEAPEDPDSKTGILVLQLLAAGGDPSEIAELSTGAAAKWLRYLRMAGIPGATAGATSPA